MMIWLLPRGLLRFLTSVKKAPWHRMRAAVVAGVLAVMASLGYGQAVMPPSPSSGAPSVGGHDGVAREIQRDMMPRRSTLAQRGRMGLDGVDRAGGPMVSGELMQALFDVGRCAPLDAAAVPGASSSQVTTAVASSSAPLDLGSALRLAVCASAGVRQGAGLVQQAQAGIERADLAGTPTVSAGPGLQSVRGFGTSATVGAQLQWALFDFGNRTASQAQARSALAATLDEQRAEVLDAMANAAQLFTAAQAAQGRMVAANHNLTMTRNSLAVAEGRAAGGAGTVTERLQAKTAQEQALLEAMRAETGWLVARSAMNLSLGLPANRDTRVVLGDAETLMAQDIDLAAMVDEARERHPQVTAARARLRESRQRAEALGSQRWGQLTLDAESGRSRQLKDLEGARHGGQTRAGLVWSIPLMDRGVIQSSRNEALGAAEVRRVAALEAQRRVELQIWQEGRSLLGELDTVRASRQVQEAAERALEAASERYRAGVGGFNDVLQVQAAAGQARFQSVEALANAQRAALRLAAAAGRVGPLGVTAAP